MIPVDLSALPGIFAQFSAEGSYTTASRIGTGHINDTFHVLTNDPAISFILQRINPDVFKDIPGLMNNIGIVTRHLENKILSGDPYAASFSILRLIPATNQELYVTDDQRNCWRLYNFIQGTSSHDVVENPEMAYRGGKAFGLFQHLTSDISNETLKETIPYFHNIEKRLETFQIVVRNDTEGRVREVAREIEFVKTRENEMRLMQNLVGDGTIPVRVTHNDTKFNNILFDKHNQAVCIVDLDTVMPGTVLYDFGDAIRTGANRAAEDEKDLTKITLDLDLFHEYTRGYLETAGRFLSPVEISHLAFSAKFMTFIIGIRFLTDYIDGDHYYRILFPGHNLQRARSQFRLLETMEGHFEEMKEIVNKALGIRH
ncbi:MAG: aminoglycoside phosphotransferase family protein [Bacteroidetes bacterium]|nr:aminoglycoside phosphotransferase family protein [Bacteroidota bacterium]